MPQTPDTQPSIDQLTREIRAWQADTRLGRTAAAAVEVYARNMAVYVPDVDPHDIGVVMLRLASLLANEREMPTPLLVNLVAAAGADLIAGPAPDRKAPGDA